MKERKLEDFDKALIGLLSEDGRMPIGEMAKKLEVTNPTIGSRIKKLLNAGIMKIGCLINPSNTSEISIAIIGITLEIHELLDEKINQIADLSRVHWAAVVTGRYDIIVEVILQRGESDLYQFLTEDLPRVGEIRSSESFVVMKTKKKWISLPPESWHWR